MTRRTVIVPSCFEILKTYLVTSHSELFVVLFEFEYLIMMDFSNRRWIIKKLNLDFRRNRFLLLVILSTHLEGVLDLNKKT